MTAPNGDTEAYSYDALNRCTIESAQTGGAVSLFDYAYGYDFNGNVFTVAETYPGGLADRTVTNTYDAINRLHVEAVAAAVYVTTTYDYDAANNRSDMIVVGGPDAGETDYNYNNLNQLTGYGVEVTGTTTLTRSVSLGYDNNGNRTSRTVTLGSDAGTDSYTYDFENRLIGLVKGTSGGAGTYAYTYDYRTRRIVRDESGASGGATTAIIYSGGTSVQEYDNGVTTPTVEYARGSDYGGGVGGILYTLRGGIPSYTHENKRGDVVAKTDSNGSLTYQAQYEAFGKQVATSGTTLDRQKSNSKDTDPTGLVDEGFRYRDLETGMFISRDPAGFVDGPNLYTYVVQNPWTSFDPEGLDANSTTPPPPPPPADPPTKSHVNWNVQQPAQPSPSARSTQQQTQQETSPDHKNGGFAQTNSGDCAPTATREVIYGATGKDPGNLDKEEGKSVFNDENHNWSGPNGGMNPTPGNQREIMKNHGADEKTIMYDSTGKLLDQVGTTPVSVGGTFSNAPKDANGKPEGPGHQVTISKNPNGDGFNVTNVTGQPGVGGSETVSRQQAESGQIPVPIGGKVYQGAPTYKIDSFGWGITATPSAPSSSPP